jgi:uncharacterized membrane protein
MTAATTATLTGLLVFGTSVWVGGLIAIAVVARAASATLEPAARVAFFRGLGRRYGVVGTTALALAYGTGAALLYGRGWSGEVIAAAAVAAVLAATLAVGVAQARRMTRLRGRLLSVTDDAATDDAAAAQVRRGAARAGALRGLIALLSLVLLGLGVALAT